MNVLSLFDGMSCGQLALQRAGIYVDNYFASEIDKHAIKVTMKNFPNTIQLGTVVNWREWNLPHIDLLIAGSPCQGFSKSGKGLNFDDPRSKLFFEFIEIRKALQPDKWMLENVDMKKEWRDIISDYMGIRPVKINSAKVSAQNRVRLYWANWNVRQPQDRHIYLKDIIEDGNTDRAKDFALLNSYARVSATDAGVKHYQDKKIGQLIRVGNLYPSGGIAGRIYSQEGKSPSLRTATGGNHMPKIEVQAGRIVGRRLNNGKRDDYNFDIPLEQMVEVNQDPRKTNALTTVEKDNILIVPEATKKGYAEIFPNEGVDLSFPTSATRRGRRMSKKSNALQAGEQDFNWYNGENYRKLTVTECERLQTVDDGYTEGVSDTQRYKMLGNGWTVDVIAHIFSQMESRGELWHMARQPELFGAIAK